MKPAVLCCSNAEHQPPVASHAVAGSDIGHLAAHHHHQQQQQQTTAVSSGNQQSAAQQLQSRGSAEGLQRVNSPGPTITFDAAAYAAAAAARTASPGQLGCDLLDCLLAPKLRFQTENDKLLCHHAMLLQNVLSSLYWNIYCPNNSASQAIVVCL